MVIQLAKALLPADDRCGSIDIVVPMKAVSHSGKTKRGPTPRSGRSRPPQGDLFLGYKALHELRILMRIASAPPAAETKPEKPSY
jgi:hypothetical protein